MNENKHIADSIDIAEGKEKYDRHIKIILSDKQILAKILKETVLEFKEISFEKTMECIEGEPEVGTVPVYPGKTNLPSEAITGLPTEDKVPNEGDITFDIRFYAVTPDGDKVKLIINVEAQKKYHVGYDLVTRAVFYCARMISAQKETEFTGENYDDIKKVYSIWICMDTTKAAANTITRYHINQDPMYGTDPTRHRYDLMTAVMVCLGNNPDDAGTELHKMLSVLLSEKIKAEEKKDILNKQFGISMKREVVDEMCNLSDILVEKGIEQGKEQGIENSITNLMKNLHFTVEEAMKALSIPEDQWEKYRSMLQGK